MVSPNRLRLLSALADGTVADVTPTVADDGSVAYPDAQRVLNADDRETAEALAALAERGLLEEHFREKVYLCPVCDAEGMRYTTACGACGSPHTIRTELVEHVGCGYVDERAAFDPPGEDAPRCPDCGGLVGDPEETAQRSVHVCRECGEREEAAAHALRCRECDAVRAPEEAGERVLYRYALDERGRRWLDRQLDAREALVAAFESRGFDVRVDATVAGDGEEHPVHVYATDDLLADAVVAAVHERPDETAVRALVRAAEAADARAFLLTTAGELDERAAALAEERGVLVVTDDAGELRREYDVRAGGREDGTLFGRLTSAFRQRDAG